MWASERAEKPRTGKGDDDCITAIDFGGGRERHLGNHTCRADRGASRVHLFAPGHANELSRQRGHLARSGPSHAGANQSGSSGRDSRPSNRAQAVRSSTAPSSARAPNWAAPPRNSAVIEGRQNGSRRVLRRSQGQPRGVRRGRSHTSDVGAGVRRRSDVHVDGQLSGLPEDPQSGQGARQARQLSGGVRAALCRHDHHLQQGPGSGLEIWRGRPGHLRPCPRARCASANACNSTR